MTRFILTFAVLLLLAGCQVACFGGGACNPAPAVVFRSPVGIQYEAPPAKTRRAQQWVTESYQTPAGACAPQATFAPGWAPTPPPSGVQYVAVPPGTTVPCTP